jgi:hypothetical protein
MKEAHDIAINHENAEHTLHSGHRARCSCGWWSDCYSQLSATQRAVEVHLRRSETKDIQQLIANSSIGRGLADIKERGIDAHLKDLEKEMRPRARRRTR